MATRAQQAQAQQAARRVRPGRLLGDVIVELGFRDRLGDRRRGRFTRMRTPREAGLAKVRAGETSPAEAGRVVG